MSKDKYGDPECADVHDMHSSYGFKVNYQPTLISFKEFQDRVHHLEEELDELKMAILRGDLSEIADALVDIVVITKGTAVMTGLPWNDLWKEVHRANSEKVPGINPKRPEHDFDLIKPPGWVAPRIQQILNNSKEV